MSLTEVTYIPIGKRPVKVAKTRKVSKQPFVALDFDEEGRLVGVEVITRKVSRKK